METIAIGILTNANQFIRTKPVNILELPRNLPIEYLDGTDYYEFDRAISSGTNDSETYNMVKNIRLETVFYNLYRQTFKTLLNEPSSYMFKNLLSKSLERGIINENNKVIIKELIEQGIEFVDDMKLDDITIANLDEITTCFNTNTNAINCPAQGLCFVENGICKLLLPRINLVNKKTDNKISYYDKLLDELLRYKRIKNYIFEPDAYLAIRETNFKLHSNEYL